MTKRTGKKVIEVNPYYRKVKGKRQYVKGHFKH
jgi:hypothetical protein